MTTTHQPAVAPRPGGPHIVNANGRRLPFAPPSAAHLGWLLLVPTATRKRLDLRCRPSVEAARLASRRSGQIRPAEESGTVGEHDRSLFAQAGLGDQGRSSGVRTSAVRPPARAELAEPARRDGLSVIHLAEELGSVLR